jgi:hypothetical protein
LRNSLGKPDEVRAQHVAWCSIFMSYPLAAQANVTAAGAWPSMERSRCCILLSFDFQLKAPGTDTFTLKRSRPSCSTRAAQIGAAR